MDYFTLCAECMIENEIDYNDITYNFVNVMLDNHPAYDEPKTYGTIVLTEHILDTVCHKMDTYLVTMTRYDDDNTAWLKVYKNTY